jgi:hypothetical protein
MGSPLVAGWIAHVAFWTLLGVGAWSEDLGPKLIATFLILWAAAMFGAPYLPIAAALSTPFIAVLDVVLVFIVFKGDIRLT